MDITFLETKAEKLNQKFQTVKDKALQEIINISNALVVDINEINQERAEIADLLKDSKMSEENTEAVVEETPVVESTEAVEETVAPEAVVESAE